MLRSNIATDTIAAAVLLRRDGCVGTLRVGELAHRLLLLLLPLRDLVAGILLLVLEHQLARELLVQLRLFGLEMVGVSKGRGSTRCDGWSVSLVGLREEKCA